jgi:hypothetical protein
LLEDLHVEDEVIELIGNLDRLPVHRYPQAVAVALALRHSWRPDDFEELVDRLGLGNKTAVQLDKRSMR